MIIRRLLPLALAIAAVPGFAAAQGPTTSEQQLQIEKKPQRIIVRPRVAPEVVVDDADQVASELTSEARREQMLRDSTSLRRPDLDRDVTGGIQTRALNARGR